MDFEMPGLQSEHVSAVRDEALASRYTAKSAGPTAFIAGSSSKALGEVSSNVPVKRYEKHLKEKLALEQQNRIPHLNLLELVHIDETTSENTRGRLENSCIPRNDDQNAATKCILPENLYIDRSFHGATSLFAKVPIARGELVHVESPLVAYVSQSDASDTTLFNDEALETIAESVRSLDEDDQESFELLCSAYCGNDAIPKCYFNLCLPIEDNSTVGTAVFAVASRFSHSCTPNLEQHWNSKTSSARFVATRDIAIGEELTLAYLDVLCGTTVRRNLIEETFLFECVCPTCLDAPLNLRASDIRRERIKALDQKISRAIQHEKFESAVKFVRERIKLLQTEGLDSAKNLLRCEYDGFRASLELGNLKDSERFFELACQHSDEAYGADSTESCNLQLQARDLEFQRAMFEAIYQ